MQHLWGLFLDGVERWGVIDEEDCLVLGAFTLPSYIGNVQLGYGAAKRLKPVFFLEVSFDLQGKECLCAHSWL